MKTSESIVIAQPVLAKAGSGLFEAVDSSFLKNPFRARQIFVPVRSNRLKLALASLYALFTNIHQKFATRRMGIINGS